MNPYLIIGLLIAWAASLGGVGWWQNEAGHVAERTTWQGKESTELRLANTKVLALEEAARKTEQDHAASLAEIATDYERKLSDANKQRADDVAAVRAGTLRLRDPNPPGQRACGDPTGAVAAGPGQCDGGAPGELSGDLAEFLVTEADRADGVARQLTACQRVVMEDRDN